MPAPMLVTIAVWHLKTSWSNPKTSEPEPGTQSLVVTVLGYRFLKKVNDEEIPLHQPNRLTLEECNYYVDFSNVRDFGGLICFYQTLACNLGDDISVLMETRMSINL